MKKRDNELVVLLTIFKSPEIDFNSNNLSKVVGISSMGTLKILKKLESSEILVSKKIGNMSIYSINWKNIYAIEYIGFLLKKEEQISQAYIKRWISELKKVKEAEIIILFGSVLKQGENSKDIDVLFIIKENNLKNLIKKISEIDNINEKIIHPIYQNIEDLKKNIKKRDKVILNAIKGIVILGHNKFVKLIKN
jgi:predicted nucleotidyltransferase